MDEKKKMTYTPYHCGMYIAPDSSRIELVIAWRRIADKDYGIYLAAGGQSPVVMNFLAQYSPKGEMQFFWVMEGLAQEQEFWDIESLSGREQEDTLSDQDKEILKNLTQSLFNDWVETAGFSDINRLFKRFGAIGSVKRLEAKEVLESRLPLQVRSDKMPDFWSFLVKSTEKWHFAFMDGDSKMNPSRDNLLMEKMNLFLELI